MIYLRLFFEFFKTGLFAVGGGLATLPFLYDLGARSGWFTSADVANMLAVSESTPGAIGVNMATYVGYTVGGVPGALVATLALITPSIIVILIVALFLNAFHDNFYVKAVFYGLRPASTGLIASAGLSVAAMTFLLPGGFGAGGLAGLFNYKSVILGAVLLALTNIPRLKKLHPIVFLALSAAVGIVFGF